MSFAICQDDSMDSAMESKLKNVYEKVVAEPSFKMEKAEGLCCHDRFKKVLYGTWCLCISTRQEQIHVLDPMGIFAGLYDK